MALTTTARFVRHVIADGAPSKTFDFQVDRPEDVRVRFITALAPDPAWLVFGVDYTVQLNVTATGGTVTFTPALVGAGTVEIERATAMTQQRRFRNIQRFPAEAAEAGFDQAMMGIQDVREELARAIVLPRGVVIDPSAAAIAVGTVPRLNDAGDAIEWVTLPISETGLNLRFTPGGDGQVSFYRVDATHAQNPRTALIAAIAGDVITLTTAVAATFFLQQNMLNVSYVRIWNISKVPEQSAWVKAQPAGNQLQVLNAAALAGWLVGETIQVGDPLSVTPNRVIAIDISPMMQNTLGSVFRQAGILVKMSCANIGAASAEITLSENGAAGTFTGVKDNSFTGEALPGQVTIPCSVLSPVSDSNLVFVRETVTGANMGISLASAIGLWV